MSETSQSIPSSAISGPTVPIIVATVLLVLVGDLLLFDVEPGSNLFVFGLAVAAVLAGQAAIRGHRHRALLAFAIATVFSLPLIETASFAGLLLASLGMAAAALIGSRLMPDRFEATPEALLRLVVVAPFRLAQDALSMRPVGGDNIGPRIVLGAAAWVIPLGLSLIFLVLFAAANPLIEGALASFQLGALFGEFEPVRIVFWLVLAAAVWAVLQPKLLQVRFGRQVETERVHAASLGYATVLRSLLLFNALFAVQTGLDLLYLWGGVALPNGMSYAEYAHRGAYPLMVTALLAAGFVLVAMRRDGPGDNSVLIRGLVYAWIGQNVLLCLSAILRLDLYVEVYSLTELRVAAGLWMALVASGLLLILLRIWLRRSNAWLVATNLVALLGVVYLSAIADYPALIAQFNVAHSQETGGQGMPLDLDYIADLGPSAIPALDAFIAATDDRVGPRRVAMDLRQSLAAKIVNRQADWRSWTWRQQRLANYLQRNPIASVAPTTQNR